MEQKRPERVPVMCQMANGHTVINTEVDPIDYSWMEPCGRTASPG